MPNYLNQSDVAKNIGGFSFFSSGSTAFESTSSNAATAAQLDISINSSLPTNIINNTTLNPYIRFTVISGSNRSDGIDQEIIIRFFSSSHIQPKYTSSANTTNPGYVLIPSRSLYITSSNTEAATIIDVPYTNPTSYSTLASSLHDILTGSSYFVGNSLSASKNVGEDITRISIHYTNNRGAVGTSPTVYTGSGAIPLGSGISVSYTSTGSGALNFTPQSQLHFASSSYQFRLNTEDQNSLELTQGISSSGFTSNTKTESTLLFFSSSGKIGVGTRNPKADFDISGSIQGGEIITKPTTGRPIRIKDSEIKFYETTQIDPNHADYGDNKERARIKATPGSFNLTFEVSGSSGYTNSVYISQSGKIGFNTDDPQSEFDVLSNEVQFQKPGSRKGLRINDEGNIESFNKEAASAATGSEFILKYSRGASVTQASLATVGITVEDDSEATTFFNALKAVEQNSILEKIEANGFIAPAQTGDTLGAIRWVAESGSLTTLDPRSTGETAVLKAVVSDVDASGVQADLIFSVAGKTGAAEQVMLLDAGGNHEMTGSLNVTGNFKALNAVLSGDITLANNRKIKNANESNTYIQVVNDDYWRINANNINVAYFASTQFRVNPDSGPTVDFIVNSDNNVAINMNANDETLTFGVPITSSQDISSSGAITADTLAGKLNGGSF